MSGLGLLQILVYLIVLTALGVPLGRYMAWVFERQSRRRARLERSALRLVGSDGAPQDWKHYARSLILFSLACFAALYFLLRLQGHLPFNPEGLTGVGPVLAMHTAVSFVSSTNWQFFAGESTMSDLSQMAGLAVQNFIAPAVGLGVLLAVTRGFSRRSATELGNFWRDVYRAGAICRTRRSVSDR
jgi:potassium-transporting ATPase potassium-binding subunit